MNKELFFADCHVVYQPIYNIKRRSVTSYEALIRHSNMSVEELLSHTSSNNIMNDLFEFVLLDSIRVISLYGVCISINVAPSQLINSSPWLCHTIKNALIKNPKALGKLTIEVTESEQICCYDTLAKSMEALREISVRFSIDDFGNGYTSFKLVRDSKFENIKIDREWVSFVDKKNAQKELLKAIIAFSELEGINVIAEGVERDEEFLTLSEIGVSYIQGFYISKPLNELGLIDAGFLKNIA